MTGTPDSIDRPDAPTSRAGSDAGSFERVEEGRTVRPTGDDWIRQVYDDYSEQRLDALLPRLSPDVDWPDGPRRMRGRTAVEHYWVEQWSRLLTRDLPVAIAWLSPTVCVVRLDQQVRTSHGRLVRTAAVVHVLQLEGPSIRRLDIVPLTGTEGPAPAIDRTSEGNDDD